MRLVDGMGRAVRPTRKAIEVALRGDTSIVSVEGSELSILWSPELSEINVCDAHDHHTFDLGEVRDAIATFVDMAGA